jgi:hypothetical protein
MSMSKYRHKIGPATIGNDHKTAQDKILTHCKICGLAIYTTQPRPVWLTKPLGLSHQECASDITKGTVGG